MVVFLRKEILFSLLLLFTVFYNFSFVLSEDINTNVTVLNTLPFLEKDILNQTWAMNTNLTDSFFLTDFFKDDNGDNLSFNYSNLSDIEILINSTSSLVSFYPQQNFVGTRNVTFYASDSEGVTPSNLVYLNVGTDNEAPKWFDNLTSSSSISQNDFIDFSVKWTDNTQLKSYIFSINQGSGWINSSEKSFSGLENFSVSTIQISAAPGSTVYWKFYARDTSDNFNFTDNFNFKVNTNNSPVSPPSSTNDSSSNTGSSQKLKEVLKEIGLSLPKKFDFEVSLDFFLLEVFQGGETSVFFNIKNIGTEELKFNLSFDSFKDSLSLDIFNFNLISGKKKGVLLDYLASKEISPGQYFDNLIISANGLTKQIPISILVKPNNPLLILDLYIYDKLVKPGEEVYFSVDLQQENFKEEIEVSAYFAIKSFKGIVIDSSEEKLKLREFLKLNRSLFVPKETKEGDYLIYSRIEFGKKIALDVEPFQVGYKSFFASFFKYSFYIVFLLVLSLIFVILFMKYERNKRKDKLITLYILLLKLKNYLRENDLANAAEIYILIKTKYGEKVPLDLIKDKEFLKKELVRLSSIVQKSVKELPPEEELKDKEVKELDESNKKKIVKVADKKIDKSKELGDVKNVKKE